MNLKSMACNFPLFLIAASLVISCESCGQNDETELTLSPGIRPHPVVVNPMTMQDVAQLVKSSHDSVVLLQIFASWCPPCRAEFPTVIALGQKYRAQGLKIIAVSEEDDSTELIEFLRPYYLRYDMPFNPVIIVNTSESQFMASLREIGSGYDGGIPYSAIYDRTGKLSHEWKGQKTIQSFENVIVPLLR